MEARPEGIEVVPCVPGAVEPGLETYVVHNHMLYSDADLRRLGGKIVRYHHDVRPQKVEGDVSILCSPLQQKAKGVEDCELVPPAIDIASFRKAANGGERHDTVCVGAYRNPDKGGNLVSEWARDNGFVDYFGFGGFGPEGQNVERHGPVRPSALPDILARYQRFVCLPSVIEPFGRCVAEAWAAGCELIVNRNVGALYWIQEKPDALETAAADFWKIVTE